MNKILVYATTLLTVATGLVSCAGEEDDIFSASAAERLNEAKDKYSARLQAQPNGWAMQYYPTYADEAPYGNGYLILMDFDEDFSVKVAMDNAFSNNTYAEERSPWGLITDNGPVLSFNTGNSLIHAFSDPEDIPWTEENEQSEGCGGDYEFIIVDAPEDASYMMLKGKKRNTYNLLTPVEEGIDYKEYLADVKSFHKSKFLDTELVGLLMHFGDSIYRMDGSNDGLPNIYPDGSDAIANESFHPFLVTKRGSDYYVRFRDAFERSDMEGALQELRYDSISREFIGTDNANWRITGYPPLKFFKESVEGGHKFQINASTVKSETAAELYTNLRTGLSSTLKYTLQNVWLIEDQDENGTPAITLRINYNTRVGTLNVSGFLLYTFDTTKTDESITLANPKPVEAAQTVLERTPAVQAFLDAFSTGLTINDNDNPYNLSTLKLTLANNNDTWFNVTYIN